MKQFLLLWVLGCGGSTSLPPTAPVDNSAPPRVTVSLRLSETTGDLPASHLTMVIIRDRLEPETHPLGEIEGICTHEIAVPPAIAQVSCWWAGEGQMVRVRREGHVLVAERGGIGEATELARVMLEPSTQVEAIAPH